MGLHISASGILNILRRQDVTAHNVANLRTPGFRAGRAHSSETEGGGARVDSIDRNDAPGSPELTGRPLDVASPDGFFQVALADGRVAFTRDGHFGLNADGELVTADGARVSPAVQAPPGSSSIQVLRDGRVSAVTPGSNEVSIVGRLEVFAFSNPDGLEAIGGNLFVATAASGGAQAVGTPPNIEPGALQGSNVDLVTEQTNALLDRQAFQANINALRLQDEVLGELLDLRE